MPDSFHSEQYKIFITLLRETRKELGVSQEELALALGMPQTTVSKSENGIRRVDIVELHAWLRALDVDLTEFMATLLKRWDAHTSRAHLHRKVVRKS